MNIRCKGPIFILSTGHKPEINETFLMSELRARGYIVNDLSFSNVRRYGVIRSLQSIFLAIRIKSIINLKYFPKIFLAKNVAPYKFFFYCFQTLTLPYPKEVKQGSIFIFRGCNNPLIPLIHKIYRDSKVVVIPHGLYFCNPPENDFFKTASGIVTGTDDWPEKEYHGTVAKIGMLEVAAQSDLQAKYKQNDLAASKDKVFDIAGVVTTHGSDISAMYLNKLLFAIRTKRGLSDNYFTRLHIRFHPGDKFMPKYFSNIPESESSKLNGMGVQQYVNSLSHLIFIRGRGNRISNVIYESLNSKAQIIIYDNDISSIVNLPAKVRSEFHEPILSMNDSQKLKEILSKSVFQSDNFIDDLIDNVF
jgi:hypothetical protein